MAENEKLSEQQVKLNLVRHLHTPAACPVCGGSDGEEVSHSYDAYRVNFIDDEMKITQTVSCTCGAAWTDLYKLVAVDIADYGSRADEPADPDKPVREFLKLVANLTKDGEIEVHDGEDVRYEQKPDDAIATLQSLIVKARKIAKEADIDTDTYDAEVHIDG